MDSPYAPIFRAEAEPIPAAFREQFLYKPDLPYDIRLEGRLEVWRKRWLAPLFWLLGKLGVLLAQTGRDVPTTLVITAGRDKVGEPYQVYRRRFGFKKPERFDSVTIYEPRLNKLVEFTGPLGAMQVVWEARFIPPDTFTYVEGISAIGSQHRRFVLPRPLSRLTMGDLHLVQRAEGMQSDTVHMDFVMKHPLLGEMFGYKGTLRVMRVARDDEPTR